MLIWLRNCSAALTFTNEVGIDSDVIRREDAGCLLDLEDGFAALASERQRVLDAARRQADSLLQEARETAEALRADAARIREAAYQEGFCEGTERAVSQWHARAVQSDEEYCKIRQRMRERLAELVTQAVERIVVVEDARTLFERALDAVDRISEKASYLTVSVSADDYAQAAEVFERFVHDWSIRGRTIKLTVRADKRLAKGSCLCESDFGVIDASLETQFKALKAAAERALGEETMASNDASALSVSDTPANESADDQEENRANGDRREEHIEFDDALSAGDEWPAAEGPDAVRRWSFEERGGYAE